MASASQARHIHLAGFSTDASGPSMRMMDMLIEGKEGARQFAAKHAEAEGRKQSVTLTSLDERSPGRFLATLEMTNREVSTDELLYSMDVGGVIEVRDGLITCNRAFPSPEEAAAAM